MPEVPRIKSVCISGREGLKGNRVQVSDSPAAVSISYCYHDELSDQPPLRVLCPWEGDATVDKVCESEDLQCSSKCFEESYRCGYSTLGIHSPKRSPLF